MSLTDRLKKLLDVTSSVAVIVAAGAMTWSVYGRLHVSATGLTPPEPVANARLTASALTKKLGTAKTVIIEFADFQCPFCAEHATGTFPRLKKELIDSGQVSYAYMHFPLQKIHPLAFGASEAAECAGQQGKYWEMHGRLFAQPKELRRPNLMAHAESLGIDRARFETCLSGSAAAVVNADIKHGESLQVSSTPQFFIGTIDADGQVTVTKRFRGATDFESLKSAVTNPPPPSIWSPRRWLSMAMGR